MEKLKVRCRSCQKELIGQPGKVVTCGCANRTVIRGDVISAVDLSKTVLVSGSFGMPNVQTANASVRKRAAGNTLGIESDLTSTTNVEFSVANYFNTLQTSRDGTVTLYVLEYN